LRPTLEVDSVKLANAPGFAPATMATLDRVDLRLALLPLLHRHIEIEQFALVHPVIGLQIDSQGHDNWHFPPPSSPEPASPRAEHKAEPATSTARPTTLQIQTMSIADGVITFADARTGAAFGADAVQLTATQDDPDGPIHLDLTATDRAMPIGVSGDIGRPDAQFMPLDLTLTAADASLTVKGTAPSFAVSGSIPNLDALSPLAGRALPAFHIASFRTDVAPPAGATYANGIVLSGLGITAPTGDLAGEAAVTLAKPVVVRANLTGRNVDPATMLAALPKPEPVAIEAPPARGSSFPAAPAPELPPVLLLSDRSLPFASLPPDLDADLTLTLQDTKAGEATIKSVAIHVVLHAGHLVLDPVAIDALGGHVDATAMLDAKGAAALTLRAPSLAIQPLLSALDEPDGVRGNLEVRADLHGAGTTPHALVSGLDGTFGVALANGEIDNRLLVALLSRVAPEAGLLDLAGKATRSSLRCIALRGDVAHGVVDLKALLLDTVPLRLTGGGSVDLGAETLALHLLPLVRVGASGMSMPVNVQGSFRAPKAAIDASGKGFGGIIMGALGADRMIAGSGQADGCAEQLQLARFGEAGPLPPALPGQEAGKPAPSPLNSILKQLLR
jgi:uncharacterized protein involved in outer membrane biogenesis